MRRSVELDESSLVEVFSRVADARHLARCGLVCRRWWELCFAGTRLHFSFWVKGQKELNDREDIMLRVLRRAKVNAPGCLKELKVTLGSRKDGEVLGIWLACADSLTALDLEVSSSVTHQRYGDRVLTSRTKHLRWGRGVLPMISWMGALESLNISGGFSSSSLARVATESSLRRLRRCSLYEPRGADAELLEGLLAACPLLEELVVDEFEVLSMDILTVSSTILKSFTFLGARQDAADPYEVVLDTPKLTTFVVGGFLRDKIDVDFQAESLETLELHSGSDICRKFAKLRRLEIRGAWYLADLVSLFELNTTIAELRFNMVDSIDDLIISTLLRPLNKLRSFHFDPPSLHVLKGDGVVQCNLQALEFHLWLATDDDFRPPDGSFLKALFRYHGARNLAIHCKHLIDWRSRSTDGIPRYWHKNLLELMVFYPGCITFC